MPRRLSELLDSSRISLRVQSTARLPALEEVARLFRDHPAVTNFQGFYAELLARERLDTTCLGNGIALPHARTEHIQEIVLAVGRSTQGIAFENDHQTVNLLFILGTPKSNPTDYLNVVSMLCKLLKDPAHRESLLAAESPEDFINAVKTIEAKLPGLAAVRR